MHPTDTVRQGTQHKQMVPAASYGTWGDWKVRAVVLLRLHDKLHTCGLPGAVATLSKVLAEYEATQRVPCCKQPCIWVLQVDLLNCKVNIVCEAGAVDSWACELQACTAPIVEHHRTPPFLCDAGAHPLAVPLTAAPWEHALVSSGNTAGVAAVK